MDLEDRQFLFTTVWLFARHGQRRRARVLCEALVEESPEDAVAAITLAQLLLDDEEAERALDVVRGATVPPELSRAAALLECRALGLLGRKTESERRWKRYLSSQRGAQRSWVEGGDAQ